MHKHRRYNQFCANGHAGLRSVYLTVPPRVYLYQIPRSSLQTCEGSTPRVPNQVWALGNR